MFLLEIMIYLLAQVYWLTICFVLLLNHCYLLLRIITSHLRGKYIALIKLIYGTYA